MSNRSTIAVNILTGFLGAGKTTLLNQALASGFGAGTAVIVNEFGDIALDQMFIQERSEETIVLKSGCICCSIRTDLVSTLMQLAAIPQARPSPLRRVIIETSGISDPVPILVTLRSDFNLLTRFHFGSAVCVVDATAPRDGRAESMAQLTAADACVITKRDLLEQGSVDDVAASIHALNPTATILAADALASWFEANEAPGRDIENLDRLESRVSPVSPSHAIRSLVLRVESPRSWPMFAIWLSALVFQHGDKILRVKGILYDPARDAWIAVHAVRRFLHPPEHRQPAKPPARGACLVFIVENLDPDLIAQSYRRWVIQDGEPDLPPRGEIETVRIAKFSPMLPVINQGTAR